MKIYKFSKNKRIEQSKTTDKVEKKLFSRYSMRVGEGLEKKY